MKINLRNLSTIFFGIFFCIALKASQPNTPNGRNTLSTPHNHRDLAVIQLESLSQSPHERHSLSNTLASTNNNLAATTQADTSHNNASSVVVPVSNNSRSVALKNDETNLYGCVCCCYFITCSCCCPDFCDEKIKPCITSCCKSEEMQ